MGTNQLLSDNASFQKNLAFGQIAESEIARWIMRRGATVLPIYDIEYDTGKGPRVFRLNQSFIAPDLLVFSRGNIIWIEAKHKKVFSWYRIGGYWCTGIDLHHYNHYRNIEIHLKIPVWLLFLHRQSIPDMKDRRFEECPAFCPVGLFGNSLQVLLKCESHRSDRHGKSGMVYWAERSLTLFAPLAEVDRQSNA